MAKARATVMQTDAGFQVKSHRGQIRPEVYETEEEAQVIADRINARLGIHPPKPRRTKAETESQLLADLTFAWKQGTTRDKELHQRLQKAARRGLVRNLKTEYKYDRRVGGRKGAFGTVKRFDHSWWELTDDGKKKVMQANPSNKTTYERAAPTMGTTTPPQEITVHYGPEGPSSSDIVGTSDPEVGWLEAYIEEVDPGRTFLGVTKGRKTKRLWKYYELPTAEAAYLRGRPVLSAGESDSMAFTSLREAKKWVEGRIAGRDDPFPTYKEWAGIRTNPTRKLKAKLLR